jgi:very-short-patch-repair endonuclease
VPQYRVADASGEVARVDFAYPGAGIAIEADGFAWHSSRSQFAADRRRRNALTLSGWVVLAFTWDQMTNYPDAVGGEIRRALEQRGAVSPLDAQLSLAPSDH